MTGDTMVNKTEGNTTNSTFKFDDPIQRYIVGTCFLLICIAGFAGNVLVITSILCCRKLRTLNNVFVLNLSLADLLTCALLPVNISMLFSPLEDTPVPEWICSVTTAVNFTCVGVSVCSLASIGSIRMLIITRRLLAYPPRFVISIWILVTWLFPSGMIVIPAILLSGEVGVLGHNVKYGVCTQRSGHPNILLYNGINALTFSVPLLIIISSYIAIYVHVKRHSNKFRHIMGLNMSRSSVNVSHRVSGVRVYRMSTIVKSLSVAVDRQTTEFHLKRRQIQITKNMLLVVCVFVFCIIPYVVVAQNVQGVAVILVPYTGVLIYFNSCVNPVIYCRHPDFKQVFQMLLSCRWSDIPEPSDFLKYCLNSSM